jgi:hypothetical protein
MLIVLASGEKMSGKLESSTADGLTLFQGKHKTVSVEKERVAQVYRMTGFSPGRRARWAFGIGLAAGVLLHSGISGPMGFKSQGKGETNAEFFGPGLVIGGGAAGLCAVIPQRRTLLYSTPAGR